LATGEPASKPLSDKAETSSLAARADKEVQRLLPSTGDLSPDWELQQSTPILRGGGQSLSYTIPADCDRPPFEHRKGSRADQDRDFREIATVTATRNPSRYSVRELVRLGIETPGVSVIDQTRAWVSRCATHHTTGNPPTHHTVSLLPATKLNGIDVTSVLDTSDKKAEIDYTASLLQVRGLLAIVQPALRYQSSQLVRRTVDNLRHAQFPTAPTGPDPQMHSPDPTERPPGDMQLPAPSAEADRKLERIAQMPLVNPEQYRFGGYLPGDAMTRSADYLHFRSPTGSIACTWRTYSLFCQVPAGTYRRTPEPPDLVTSWADDIVIFGWDRIQNGVATVDPPVYAESHVLPYGNTIRFPDGAGSTECLMEREGLICTNFVALGMHLSREELTPLTPTATLARDTRPLPN
ncbi:hypothetical protein ABQE43_06975, partial [Mycolicibacter minnesotensis]